MHLVIGVFLGYQRTHRANKLSEHWQVAYASSSQSLSGFLSPALSSVGHRNQTELFLRSIVGPIVFSDSAFFLPAPPMPRLAHFQLVIAELEEVVEEPGGTCAMMCALLSSRLY